MRRTAVAALFAATLAAAFFLTGSLVHDLVEGLQRSLLPLWKAFVPLLLLIVAVMAAREQRVAPRCEKCGSGDAGPFFEPLDMERSAAILAADPTRRRLLRVLGTGGVAAAAVAGGAAAAVMRNRGWIPVARDFFQTEVETMSPHPRPEWGGAYVKSYRRLGRTGAFVSDISVGCSRIRSADVPRMAMERGVNYFDTAPDYADTRSEQALGEAMRGRRDKLFLATKFCVADGHLPDDTPVPKIVEAVEGSLKRLRTDYIDLIHIHSCDRVERLMAPNIHEAFDRLKQQGKARFLGVSTHTPNLEEVANAAIDCGRFDVMMLAYHFGMWPSFGHILDKARRNDVAVVAMKTLKGAKHTNLAEFRREADSYAQSAFRWVLSNPSVSCLVVSFREPRQVDEYLYASGTPLQPADVARLERYDELTRGDYCQPHCGVCLGSCEHQLAIHDILRYRMYFQDYGWEREGMRQYARLERNASLCASCPAPCTGTCPIGVPIREKMMDAHRMLSLVG